MSSLANRNLEQLSIAGGALSVNVTQWGGSAVTGGAGVVAAGTPRVTLASNDPAVTALEIIDDWDETNRAAVNLIAGQVAIAGGTGVDAANVPRVSLATNVALPTGANTIGTVNIGTFPDNEPMNVAQINGVTPLMGNGITGTGSQRVTIASDNTVFTVNIGTFPDNEPFNVAQFGGSVVATGTGAAGAGVPRVTVSNDSSLAANQSVNVSQVNGVTPLMGNGIAGTGSHRVTIASDSTGQVALAASTIIGANSITQALGDTEPNNPRQWSHPGIGIVASQVFPMAYNGTTWDRIRSGAGLTGIGVTRVVNANNDPCQSSGNAKSSVVVNVTADAQLIALSGSTIIYVCGFSVSLTGTTPTMRLVSGTGTVCATGLTGRTGAYAPLTGSMLTTGGIAGTVLATAAGEALCMDVEGTSPSAQGVLTYVQQ